MNLSRMKLRRTKSVAAFLGHPVGVRNEEEKRSQNEHVTLGGLVVRTQRNVNSILARRFVDSSVRLCTRWVGNDESDWWQRRRVQEEAEKANVGVAQFVDCNDGWPVYRPRGADSRLRSSLQVAVGDWSGQLPCRSHVSSSCISPNSTWLVTPRLDTTRHVRHVERVETSVSSRAVRQARHSQNVWDRHVTSNVSYRVQTWRAKCNLGFIYMQLAKHSRDVHPLPLTAMVQPPPSFLPPFSGGILRYRPGEMLELEMLVCAF